MLKKLLAWFRDEKGQDMIEYALIAAVISIPIVLVAIGLLTPAFQNWAGDVAGKIGGAVA